LFNIYRIAVVFTITNRTSCRRIFELYIFRLHGWSHTHSVQNKAGASKGTPSDTEETKIRKLDGGDLPG